MKTHKKHLIVNTQGELRLDTHYSNDEHIIKSSISQTELPKIIDTIAFTATHKRDKGMHIPLSDETEFRSLSPQKKQEQVDNYITTFNDFLSSYFSTETNKYND